MSKSNRARKERHVQPAVEEIPQELADLVGNDVAVEVTESTGEVTTEVAKPANVNVIAQAGYSMEALMKDHKNFSGVIRFLSSKGYKTNEIAKFMNKRYQHVRNVLTTPAKRAAAPAAPAPTESKTE